MQELGKNNGIFQVMMVFYTRFPGNFFVNMAFDASLGAEIGGFKRVYSISFTVFTKIMMINIGFQMDSDGRQEAGFVPRPPKKG